MNNQQPSGSRSRSRLFVVQALYQHLLSDMGVEVLREQFTSHKDFVKANADYFDCCLSGVFEHEAEIVSQLTAVMDLPLQEVRPVEQSVLRLGVYELLYQPNVPHQVIINEALELNKSMGAAQGYRYINGVLDKVAKTVRNGS